MLRIAERKAQHLSSKGALAIILPKIRTYNFRIRKGDRLTVKTGDVQGIAAAQMEILSNYYMAGIEQSNRSFNSASIAAVTGLVFFIIVIAYSIWKPQQNVVSVASLGTVLSGFISAICFYLYNKSTSQLSGFHEKLYMTQHYLLANSMCEGLEGESKEETRSAIIKELANVPMPQNNPLDDPTSEKK
jgi:hypothetical protein